MKRMLIGAAGLCALVSAAPAMAQSSAAFTVQTNVQPFCSQFSTGQGPMDLGVLTGTSGQIVTTFASSAQTERQLASNYYCNAPSTITIKADPLVHDTITVVADSSSFTNRVDYTATLNWNGSQTSVSSASSGGQVISAAAPTIGQLSLKLSNPAVTGNLRPIAGSYSGQVRLTIALAQ